MFRIVLADDHEVLRAGLKSIIAQHEDWTVCGEASTGREAIEKTLQLQPDLVILDITMPDLSGINAAIKIRNLVPSTKILVYSMHDVSKMANVLASAGVNAWVSKDASNEKLAETIEGVLRQ